MSFHFHQHGNDGKYFVEFSEEGGKQTIVSKGHCGFDMKMLLTILLYRPEELLFAVILASQLLKKERGLVLREQLEDL